MQKLTLIRGLPGSGKSTLAKTLDIPHYEADMFFMKEGKYCFDASKLHQAHQWCLSSTKTALIAGSSVVVSNTFTTKKEMNPYVDLAAELGVELEILECTANFGSVHDVPTEVIKRMKMRWETLNGQEVN